MTGETDVARIQRLDLDPLVRAELIEARYRLQEALARLLLIEKREHQRRTPQKKES